MRFHAKFTGAAVAGVFAMSLISGHIAAADTVQNQARPSAKPASAVKDTKPQPVTVTVNPGDNLSAIADAHQTTWVRIFDANDTIADPNLINPGDVVTIPATDQQLPDRYSQLATAQVAAMPTVVNASTQNAAQYSAPSAPRQTGGGANSYVWGTCTWYVKNVRPDIGSFWGNAGYNWLAEARAAGFGTGSAPAPGAIAVTAGHVAIVDAVNGDSVSISEMNYGGGVGQVHYRTVPASSFSYIY